MKKQLFTLLMLLSATIAMAQYRISTDNGTFSIQDLSNANDYGTPYPKEKIFGHQISATRVSVKIEGVTYNPKLLVKNQGIEYTDFRDGNNADATFASAAAVDAWFKQNTGFKTSAGGSADGVVSNVTISGSTLDFTGSNGGFNGEVDLSGLGGGSGSSADQQVLTESEFDALTAQEKTDYRGYKTSPIINPNLFPDGSGSISDTNDNSIWTVVNGSIENVTDDVADGTNALRFNGDGTNALIAYLEIPVEPSTQYDLSASIKGSGWAQMLLRAEGTSLNPASNISIANSSGSTVFIDNKITVTTNSSATVLRLELRQGTVRSDQYGVVDNINVIKKESYTEFTSDDIYAMSNKISDADDVVLSKTKGSNVYIDNTVNTLESNNLQNNINEIDAKVESIKSSLNVYNVTISPTGAVTAVNQSNGKTFYNTLDLAQVLEDIYNAEIQPYLLTTGIYGAIVKLGQGDFKLHKSLEFSGPHPANTEANISAFYIDGQPELSRMGFESLVTEGIKVNKGIRFGMSGIRLYGSEDIDYVLKFAVDGDDHMTTRDGYLKDMLISGRTANTLVVLENFFGVTIEDLFVRNFEGSAMEMMNYGTSTNYGNIVVNQVKLLHDYKETSFGLKVSNYGDSKRMNLLQFGNLQTGRTDVSGFDAASGNSYGTGVVFENTQNITVNQLTAEYDPVLVKVHNSANITIMQLVGTIQDAPDFATRESIGIDIVDSGAITVLGGWLYGSSRAIPLKVSGDAFLKQGNKITLMTQNGINPKTKNVYEGNSWKDAEVNIWEDGSSNYEFRSPQYKYYNGVALDNSTLNSIYSNDDTLEDALNSVAPKSGTTVERPASPNEGDEYYDSDLKKKILYNGTAWVNVDGSAL